MLGLLGKKKDDKIYLSEYVECPVCFALEKQRIIRAKALASIENVTNDEGAITCGGHPFDDFYYLVKCAECKTEFYVNYFYSDILSADYNGHTVLSPGDPKVIELFTAKRDAYLKLQHEKKQREIESFRLALEAFRQGSKGAVEVIKEISSLLSK